MTGGEVVQRDGQQSVGGVIGGEASSRTVSEQTKWKSDQAAGWTVMGPGNFDRTKNRALMILVQTLQKVAFVKQETWCGGGENLDGEVCQM